jgi:hypothetical protein
VALTAFASDELVAGAFRAGARGYIGKRHPGSGVRPFARPSRDGRVGPATERLHSLLNGTGDVIAFTERSARCSPCSRRAADRSRGALTISIKTVEKHVGSILRKLGAQNRTQAVARARSASPGRDIRMRTGISPMRHRANPLP